MKQYQTQNLVSKDYKGKIINLAAFVPETNSLGPGKRAVIWVQGCPFNCSGCIAPEWIPIRKANYIPTEQLAQEILKSKSISGLTISGGEPFLQAEALTELVMKLRNVKDLDIICFTGFHYSDLLNLPEGSDEKEFLGLIDVLIEGPYQANLNDNRGLRGSSNQRIIHLTDRLKHHDLENTPRQVEIRISDQSIMVVGIPSTTSLQGINNAFSLMQPNPGGRYERA